MKPQFMTMNVDQGRSVHVNSQSLLTQVPSCSWFNFKIEVQQGHGKGINSFDQGQYHN